MQSVSYFYSNTTNTVSSVITPVESQPPLPDKEEEEEYYPTENFSLVANGIYRSAFPKKKNFKFLNKLGLKSILTYALDSR